MGDTMKIRAAVVNYPEFFEISQANDSSYKPIRGVEYELFQILSQTVPFEYEIVSPKDKDWGKLSEDGVNWTGMVGMLQRDEADIALCAMTATWDRSNVVDFSFPYSIHRLTFSMKAAEKASKDFVYTYPFTFNVWVLICLSLLVASLLLSLLRRLQPREDSMSKKTSLFETFTTSAEILIGTRSYQKISQNMVVKLFACMFLIFMKIVVFSYAGILLSFLMNPLMEHQIATIQELAELSEHGLVKVTTFKDVQHWIPSSNHDPLKGLSQYVRENPSGGWMNSNDATVDWIMKNYAVINSNLFQLPEIHKKGMTEEIFVSPDSLLSVFSTIALRKDFCCLRRFNQIIQRTLQSGLYEQIYSNHMFRLNLRAPKRLKELSVRPIELKDLRGLLFIISSYALATVIFFLEMCFPPKIVGK